MHLTSKVNCLLFIQFKQTTKKTIEIILWNFSVISQNYNDLLKNNQRNQRIIGIDEGMLNEYEIERGDISGVISISKFNKKVIKNYEDITWYAIHCAKTKDILVKKKTISDKFTLKWFIVSCLFQ